MRAILLAAGRGRRLGSDLPKCLLSLEGKTLLERHIVNMRQSGVTGLTLVVGFQKDAITDALERLDTADFPVEVLVNERFVHGSIVSLQVAGARLLEGAIWMDADVLYPPALLAKLVASPHENGVLLDGRSEENGEEMMIGTRAGRAHKVARRVGKEWDFAGESVGFFKVGPEGGRAMKKILDDEVAAGKLDQEYEAALDRAFGQVHFGYERVDEFQWTEIDFEEDVVKARKLARSL
jgi:choline kinase